MSKGAVTVWSNSPGQPTGYGEQAAYLVERLKRDGYQVAASSNYGVEGRVTDYQTPYGSVPHYPRGSDPYSNDVAPMHHKHFTDQHKDLKNLMVTLYDVWVLKGQAWGNFPIASWTPLDHVTMPPLVEAWLRKPNVTPIAMSPHGSRQMQAKGIEHEYVPHGIDTTVFKYSPVVNGVDFAEYLKVKDKFVVGMVAANKSSGLIHRKAFSENLIAFSVFQQKHPDAVLYLHTDPLGSQGGWNLIKLCTALGIPKDSVIFPNLVDYKYGIPRTELAGYYSSMDVMLAAGFGEGFGIPTVEAQACETPVIGSGWAATPDLVSEDCWLVEGQLMWDAGQDSFWQVPVIGSIVEALEQAYNRGKVRSTVSREFALQFDVETVWDKHWKLVLGRLL